MTAAPRHLTGHASPPWCALPPRQGCSAAQCGGSLRGGTTPSQCPDALPVAAPVAGQARVPSRAEQEAAKLPDDRDKLPVDFREAIGGAGCTRRCNVDSQVPEGCASTSGRGGDAVGVHERISPASVETRRPDRSAEELAGGCAPSDPPNGNGTSWTLDRAGGSSPLRLAGPSRWLIAAPSPPADSLPRTISGSDHDRALAHAGASGPAPAQPLGERPVVPGQVCRLPAELRDLPLQGFDLPPKLRRVRRMCTRHRGLLLDTSLWKCPLKPGQL